MNPHKFILAICFLSLNISLFAQEPGDTIVVKTFNYSQTYGINQWSPGIRDTMIDFPDDPDLTFERIIMKYNMRCKDGKVSPPISGQTDIGCGEWDINCHTYITDSTRIDSIKTTHPSHFISNFSDVVFSYNSNPQYNYLSYTIKDKTLTDVQNEQNFNVIDGTESYMDIFPTNENSAKSIFKYTQEELENSGLSAGQIDAMSLEFQGEGTARFFRIKIRQAADESLDPSEYDGSAFTQVYFNHLSFITGMNQIYLDDPFEWDGISDLIVELSYSNTEKGSTSALIAEQSADISGIHAINGYYINTSSGGYLNLPVENLQNVSNEISIAFWARGNEGVSSVNTSILEAADNTNRREVNIHLPWSNSRVYWDCGDDGGGYDRIDKAANADILEENWHHWVFTKNAVSGIMNIYLDGELWHSGTGKHRMIDIQKFILGANRNLGNYYLGNIDEFSIWNVELDIETIKAWMRSGISSAHPNYNNLVAYYPFIEGTGQETADHSEFNAAATFENPAQWNVTRGKDLDRGFSSLHTRPDLVIHRADYSFTINEITALDSVLITPHLVNSFEIQHNYNSIMDDEAVVVNSQFLWQAGEAYIYDGEDGSVLDVLEIEEEELIGIYDLPFTRRFPSKIQIMSFVTPYGINLDLGPEGKTWTFDVSDYAPILKGTKRMTVEAGGQWMEDMDIQFLYIVGTPPREVLDYRNIWRVQSRGYASILNNTYFPKTEFKLDPNADAYKIRSVISGHGQEGEFIPQNHFINLNGGSEEYIWQVWMECSENPVYPQGGTWIYDRAGWCPGFPTMISEFDIAEEVEIGSTVDIDYGMYQATGNSNYWVSNTLVTYGEANFELDAAVINAIAPTNKVEYSRINEVCANPIIKIQNRGETVLQKLEIDYRINDGAVQSYTWEGSLGIMESEEVALPSPSELWESANAEDNVFSIDVHSPNGEQDEYEHNNRYISEFDMPDQTIDEIYIWFWTNNAAFESKYELFDDEGNKLFSRSGMWNNTEYRDTFDLSGGCYTFVITDTGDDGIDFWANNDGVGFCRIVEVEGDILHFVEGDFGGSYIYNFSVDPTVGVKNEPTPESKIRIFPNPAADQVFIEGQEIKQILAVRDNFGRLIKYRSELTNNGFRIDLSQYASGIYFIEMETENGIENRSFIKVD